MQTPYLVPNPDGADYSSPRCRPLSETANRLDGDSFFSSLLMLFSYFRLVRVFGIGVGGAEKRELKETERNARLSPATWNERGEAVSGLGTRKGKNRPDPSTSFPLFSSPDHPLFFDTIFTSALLTVRIFRVAGAADAVTPRMTHCCQMESGDDRSHTTRAPPLRLCRRRSRSASPTRPPSSQKACSLDATSSPFVAFPLPSRLLTLHSIGGP